MKKTHVALLQSAIYRATVKAEDRPIGAMRTILETYNPTIREFKDFNRHSVVCYCIPCQVGIGEVKVQK